MNIKYQVQVVLLVGWVLIVTMLFMTIPDKQSASLITGLGFVILPTLFLFSEIRNTKNKLHISVLLIFILCSALPIFLLRVFNWGTDFKSLSVLGVSADLLHHVSSYLYALVGLSSLYLWKRKK